VRGVSPRCSLSFPSLEKVNLSSKSFIYLFWVDFRVFGSLFGFYRYICFLGILSQNELKIEYFEKKKHWPEFWSKTRPLGDMLSITACNKSPLNLFIFKKVGDR
jgi:hypothetical protein